jgi:hypothetical protein
MNNQKGVLLISFGLIHLLMALSFLFFLKFSHINERTYRLLELKKCHNKVIYQTNRYAKKQLKKNELLKYIFYLKKVPKLSKIIRVLEKGIIFSQEIFYLVHQLNIINLRDCKDISTIDFQTKTLFKRRGKFIRNSKNLLQPRRIKEAKIISKKIPFFTTTNIDVSRNGIKPSSSLRSYAR